MIDAYGAHRNSHRRQSHVDIEIARGAQVFVLEELRDLLDAGSCFDSPCRNAVAKDSGGDAVEPGRLRCVAEDCAETVWNPASRAHSSSRVDMRLLHEPRHGLFAVLVLRDEHGQRTLASHNLSALCEALQLGDVPASCAEHRHAVARGVVEVGKNRFDGGPVERLLSLPLGRPRLGHGQVERDVVGVAQDALLFAEPSEEHLQGGDAERVGAVVRGHPLLQLMQLQAAQVALADVAQPVGQVARRVERMLRGDCVVAGQLPGGELGNQLAGHQHPLRAVAAGAVVVGVSLEASQLGLGRRLGVAASRDMEAGTAHAPLNDERGNALVNADVAAQPTFSVRPSFHVPAATNSPQVACFMTSEPNVVGCLETART